jgi:hypothetical protein
MQIHTLDPHSRGSWRHATACAFGILRLSSVASGRYKYSVLVVRVRSVVSSPFLVRDLRSSSSATTTDFLLYTLPRVSRARRMSLPCNYLRMIPIVGQIKTVLSATHADRGEKAVVRLQAVREDARAISARAKPNSGSERATMLPAAAVVSLLRGEGTYLIKVCRPFLCSHSPPRKLQLISAFSLRRRSSCHNYWVLIRGHYMQ